MSSNKKYWSSVQELKGNSSVVEALKQKEFAEEIPTDEFLGDKDTLSSSKTTRRDFLKYVGFSTAAASLAACEGPVIKSIPYVVQPERIVPGMPDYYATTMANGFDFAGVLVKTREGRPIKIEHNILANTGCNARVQASVLSLYDNKRLQRPVVNGEKVLWEQFDKEVTGALGNVEGDIVLLTHTFASPSTSRLIQDFSAKYENVRHVVYDSVVEDFSLDAFEARYGVRALPTYNFSNAETIVSIGADFLGDWAGGGHDVGYARSRIPVNGKMSRHIQFESNYSITGAKADKRIPLKPSEQKTALVALYGRIVGGGAGVELLPRIAEAVDKAATQLKDSGSRGIFVTGIPDTDAQHIALAINEAIGSTIIDVEEPRMLRQGSIKALQELVQDMNAGTVGALLMVGVNPVYSLPEPVEFVEGLKKVPLRVSFSMKADETAVLCNYIAATPHYLESWGDVQFTTTKFTLMQPTIRPLFDTRQFQDCLLIWNDNSLNYYEYIKETWAGNLGNTTWNDALHNGAFEAAQPFNSSVTSTEATGIVGAAAGNTKTAATPSSSSDSDAVRNLSAPAEVSDIELELYTSVSMGDGGQANNPLLLELPDPITRASWDNYLKISRADAEAFDLKNEVVSNGAINGSYVNLKVGDTVLLKVPVFIQPGQAKGAVSLALGYGKREAIQEEMQVGVNAFPLYKDFRSFQNVTIEKASGMHEFALFQLQGTLAGRDDIIKETNLSIFNSKEKDFYNDIPVVDYNHEPVLINSDEADIWEPFDRSIGHHFNMSIDLNACTGCAACVIACNVENNVPVVGKEEVRKFRDMHWLRIDRYYSAEDTFEEERQALRDLGTFETYDNVETPEDENPQAVFQPMLCQHCNHAPCETVCPVAATSHSRQGQNMMIYNRCVGTRYCANNCPYKVRRFNWFRYNKNDEFDYYMNNDLGRMVLNPDVTVRSRGVMEKCSFCIQRTQKTILDAKRDGRVIEDGEFHTACSLACDKGAIAFGDINDKDSNIIKLGKDKRMYHSLEGLGTKPNVMYLLKVTNNTEV